MSAAIVSLRERLHELADLEAVLELLSWDQETMMPPAGAPARAEQRATLERLHHERLTAADLGEWLAALDGVSLEEPEAAFVRVTRRDRDKALRVPPDLVSDLARAGSLGQHAWAQARAADDFAAFLPHLRELVELRRRYAACFPEFEHPYDALLDDYEPDMRTAELRDVLERLRNGLVPLVEAIAAVRDAGSAPAPLEGPFDIAAQRRLVPDVLHELGFDRERFRLDESEHPFSTGTSLGDLRITARYETASLEALFAGMHEFGHALYEAQIDPALARTPLCSGVSMGMHESQSRMWENLIGRGLPFCEFVLPRLRDAFPDRLGALAPVDLHRSVNVVRPTLIRVQADEVTYGLHIVLRFELELALIEGELAPEDLPEAWNARTRSYLGIDVPSDAAGVLQDIHWSAGAFGYFPTYALGNLIAAQLWQRINADLPGLERDVTGGDFAPLREWLREHVHRHGRMHRPRETLRLAIGQELDPEPFIDYLWAKHADVHGVRRS